MNKITEFMETHLMPMSQKLSSTNIWLRCATV